MGLCVGSEQVVQIDRGVNSVSLRRSDGSEQPKNFTFDSVYGDDTAQSLIYDESAFPLVESVLEGYNGTMFAYGQTGCGKTHTMVGIPSSEEEKGIIPRTFQQIFGCIDEAPEGTKYLVRCSYLEIYNEQILDLLGDNSGKQLEVHQSEDRGIYVKDLTQVITKSIPEIEKAMDAGNKNRKTGETAMNKQSSRSHSIFTIYVENSVEDPDGGEPKIRAGKLNLVDLAGSERQSKTKAEGARLKEAQKINLSLSALGNVISALVDGKSKHIPYRDSKLTRLLQDSLGGNTKTAMVAAVSPADYNYDETLSTLRYANRAKQIKNKPKINEDPKDALLRQYEEEIQQLREMLQQMNGGGGAGASPDQKNQMKMLMAMQTKMNKEDHVEESVDVLMAKLAAKGQKVKIVGEDGEEMSVAPTEAGSTAPVHSMQDQMKEISQLQEEQKVINDELQQKEEILKAEQEQKKKMEELLKHMEEKMVTGGQALESKDKEIAKNRRKMQLKLKEQMKIQQELLQEQLKEKEEKLFYEKQYNSIQEEVEEQ